MILSSHIQLANLYEEEKKNKDDFHIFKNEILSCKCETSNMSMELFEDCI
jgi:hypothetical protein